MDVSLTFGLQICVVISLVGASLSAVLAPSVLASGNGRRISRYSLSAMFAAFAVVIAGSLIAHSRYVLQAPHLAQAHIPFQFVIAPLFFLYVKSIVDRDLRLDLKTMLHFLPFVICGSYLVPFFLKSAEAKKEILVQALGSYPIDWTIRAELLLVQVAIYLFLSATLIWRATHDSEEARIVNPLSQEKFLKRLLGVLFAVWIVAVVRFFVSFNNETNVIVPMMLSVATSFLFFAGRWHPGQLLAESQLIPASAVPRAPRSSPGSNTRRMERLTEVMAIEHVYRQGSLTLPQLGTKIGVPAHQLSNLLNEEIGQSFTEFVNGFRIEEVKRLLDERSNDHYSILALAERAGFNSKSTFNLVFKKMVGITPSEYRESRRKRDIAV